MFTYILAQDYVCKFNRVYASCFYRTNTLSKQITRNSKYFVSPWEFLFKSYLLNSTDGDVYKLLCH